ncbi:unnamed protein product, partial [Medioppia subpectinata]
GSVGIVVFQGRTTACDTCDGVDTMSVRNVICCTKFSKCCIPDTIDGYNDQLDRERGLRRGNRPVFPEDIPTAYGTDSGGSVGAANGPTTARKASKKRTTTKRKKKSTRSNPKTIMNINELNDDCLKIVFSFIPFGELLADRRVCKDWKQVIDDYLSNITHFTYNQSINGNNKDNELTLASDLDSDDNLSNVTHFSYNLNGNDGITDVNLPRFGRCLQLMPKLTSLSVTGVQPFDPMIKVLVAKCPHISRLYMKCVNEEVSVSAKGIEQLVAAYPALTHLDVPNCDVDDSVIKIVATRLPRLVRFNFGTDWELNEYYRLGYGFTGQTLRYISATTKTLMIGDSESNDQMVIESLMAGPARQHIRVLKIHLNELKYLSTICDNMPQLREFYCSFNGGDIRPTGDVDNVGYVRHLQSLTSLEALELSDECRTHCSYPCHSLYTLRSLTEAISGLSRLKVLRLFDHNNWHRKRESIDPILAQLKRYCPDLTELGISAGLFDLKAQSYRLIGELNLPVLTIQDDRYPYGDYDDSVRHSVSNDDVVDLLKATTSMRRFRVENCSVIDNEAVKACLEVLATRSRRRIELIFTNISNITEEMRNEFTVPPNVSLVFM